LSISVPHKKNPKRGGASGKVVLLGLYGGQRHHNTDPRAVCRVIVVGVNAIFLRACVLSFWQKKRLHCHFGKN